MWLISLSQKMSKIIIENTKFIKLCLKISSRSGTGQKT